ncbi:hypothetical protein D3C75_712140 [compost metagenome]
MVFYERIGVIGGVIQSHDHPLYDYFIFPYHITSGAVLLCQKKEKPAVSRREHLRTLA